jgi:poly(3-hydroxybutyrate) depolymerase
MNFRKIMIRVVLALIGLPIVLLLVTLGFFYGVFYFPNWSSATTGTIVSSGDKRTFLLYVPKSYHRENPTPLVISLHTSMS